MEECREKLTGGKIICIRPPVKIQQINEEIYVISFNPQANIQVDKKTLIELRNRINDIL